MDGDLDMHTDGIAIWTETNARNDPKYRRAVEWLNKNGWWHGDDQEDMDIFVVRSRYLRHVAVHTENARRYRDWIFHQ